MSVFVSSLIYVCATFILYNTKQVGSLQYGILMSSDLPHQQVNLLLPLFGNLFPLVVAFQKEADQLFFGLFLYPSFALPRIVPP